MDEKTTKEMLEEEIRNQLGVLKNTPVDDQSNLVRDIQVLIQAYTELEKADNEKREFELRFSEEIRQHDLDREYRDTLERDKLAEDIRRYDLDREYRDNLEKEKLTMEKETEEKKLKENRKAGFLEAGIKFAGIVIPAGLYFLFLGLGMKLEFADNGSIASYTVRELFRSLKPKMTV